MTVGGSSGFSVGGSPGTLFFTGNLILGPGITLTYELNTPNIVGGNVNDLTDVTGDLTLDGILDVLALPNFGIGTYRLFNSTGTLTDNTLNLGSVPAGYTCAISTATANQVNLIVSTICHSFIFQPR